MITIFWTCNNSDTSGTMNQIDDVSDYWSLLSSMDRHNENQTNVGQWYRFHGFRRPFWVTSSDPQGFVWNQWIPEKYGNKGAFPVSKWPVECRNYGICWYKDAHPWYKGSWGQHGARLGPTGPRWAPCWPLQLCYLGWWGHVVYTGLVPKRLNIFFSVEE